MRVIATGKGWDNQQLREAGEEFDLPDGATGSWFKPAGQAAEPEKQAEPEKPARRARADKGQDLA